MRTLLWLTAALVSIAAAPSPADACSAPPCWPGFFTPAAGGRVPANVPGIYWRPMSGTYAEADPTKVTLTTLADPSTVLPFTATPTSDGGYLLVPTQPLSVGVNYGITDGNACTGFDIKGPSTSFEVVAAAPLPIVLGTISETRNEIAPLDVGTSSGSCTTEVTAHQIGITPDLIFEALPWTDMFHFDVLVDGQVWQRTSSINILPSVRGTWVLYHTCSSTDTGAQTGLAEGPHTVEVRATIPGTQTMLSTETLSIEMACDGDTGSGGGGGGHAAGCNASATSTCPWLALAFAPLLRRRRRHSFH